MLLCLSEGEIFLEQILLIVPTEILSANSSHNYASFACVIPTTFNVSFNLLFSNNI